MLIRHHVIFFLLFYTFSFGLDNNFKEHMKLLAGYVRLLTKKSAVSLSNKKNNSWNKRIQRFRFVATEMRTH